MMWCCPSLLLITSLTLTDACFQRHSKPANTFTGTDLQATNTSEMEDKVTCGACTEDHKHECFNGGRCCVHGEAPAYCRCPPSYYGNYCEQFSLESSGTKTLTLLSSLFGLLLTIFVFIILILLVLHTYKTNKRRREGQRQRAEVLEKKMMLIQEDMDKMTQSEKMTRLTRLSKLIEATTRAALITYPGPYVITPAPLPKHRGLPSISEKPAANFRRFSEPTLLIPKSPPQSSAHVTKSSAHVTKSSAHVTKSSAHVTKSSVERETFRAEEAFYSI